MKFHEWDSLWNKVKRECKKDGYTRDDAYAAQSVADRQDGNLLSLACDSAEWLWWNNSRPYYKAFPAIVKGLCRLKLDCAFSCPVVPCDQITIRFAVGGEPVTTDGYKLGVMLLANARLRRSSGNDKQALLMAVQSPDIPVDDMANSYAFLLNPNTDGTTIEDAVAQAEISGYGIGPEDNTRRVQLLTTRIALTLCFLSDDPSIITPDVLAADRDKYDATKDEKYVDRARRRGVVGWNIGADYEVCPHYRRPHFALRHTGKGRTVPRIVPVTGCVVHRSKLTEVPTGYILPDGTEIEGGSVVAKGDGP